MNIIAETNVSPPLTAGTKQGGGDAVMSHASITIRCPSTVHAHIFFFLETQEGGTMTRLKTPKTIFVRIIGAKGWWMGNGLNQSNVGTRNEAAINLPPPTRQNITRKQKKNLYYV